MLAKDLKAGLLRALKLLLPFIEQLRVEIQSPRGGLRRVAFAEGLGLKGCIVLETFSRLFHREENPCPILSHSARPLQSEVVQLNRTGRVSLLDGFAICHS